MYDFHTNYRDRASKPLPDANRSIPLYQKQAKYEIVLYLSRPQQTLHNYPVLWIGSALGVVILLTSYADTEFNIGNNQSYSHQLYAVGYGDGIV